MGDACLVDISIGFQYLLRVRIRPEEWRGAYKLRVSINKLTCLASLSRDGTSVIIRVAASVVADFAAASTVEGDGKLMLPGIATFFPKKSPIDEVLDFIDEKVPAKRVKTRQYIL